MDIEPIYIIGAFLVAAVIVFFPWILLILGAGVVAMIILVISEAVHGRIHDGDED